MLFITHVNSTSESLSEIDLPQTNELNFANSLRIVEFVNPKIKGKTCYELAELINDPERSLVMTEYELIDGNTGKNRTNLDFKLTFKTIIKYGQIVILNIIHPYYFNNEFEASTNQLEFIKYTMTNKLVNPYITS